MVILIGSLQQMSGTVLCALYFEVEWRMDIVYISMAITAVICAFIVFEIVQQRKLLTIQLRALFVNDTIDNVVVDDDEVSFRLRELSTSPNNVPEHESVVK